MIEAKGRNGYFKVNKLQVWRLHFEVGEIHIEIYPKSKSGKSAPASIEGSEIEMRDLIASLYDAVIKNGTEFQNPVEIEVNKIQEQGG